jgi:hypothetical protein
VEQALACNGGFSLTTIPAYRLDVTDQSAITFEERTKGAPMAIKTWFYPGDNWGREFVYGQAASLV